MVWYAVYAPSNFQMSFKARSYVLWSVGILGNVVACKETLAFSGGWQTPEQVFVKHMQWSLGDLLPLQHWLAHAFAVCLILCSLQIVHDDQNTPLNYQENLVFLVPSETAQSLDDNSPSLPALSYCCITPGFPILDPHSMRTLNSCESNHLGASGNWYSILKSPKITHLTCWVLSSCSPCIKTESRDGSIRVAYN